MTARSVDKGSDMQIFIFFLPYYTVSEASGCLKTLYVHSNLSQAVRDAQPAVGTQVFPKRTRKLCYLQQVQASSQRCFQPLTLFSVSLNIHKNRNIYTSLGYIILDGKKYSLCKFQCWLLITTVWQLPWHVNGFEIIGPKPFFLSFCRDGITVTKGTGTWILSCSCLARINPRPSLELAHLTWHQTILCCGEERGAIRPQRWVRDLSASQDYAVE